MEGVREFDSGAGGDAGVGVFVGSGGFQRAEGSGLDTEWGWLVKDGVGRRLSDFRGELGLVMVMGARRLGV